MPLVYDDVPGSWGTMSEGWPSTPYTMGKLLLCTKASVVPYGSYVVVGNTKKLTEAGNYMGYDYSKAVIRVENQSLLDKLEAAYRGMFVECRDLLIKCEIEGNPVH